jgi:hypothetical protein
MKLLFELRPVEHLEASVDYYRELGLEPIAWPSDDSALLGGLPEKPNAAWPAPEAHEFCLDGYGVQAGMTVVQIRATP